VAILHAISLLPLKLIWQGTRRERGKGSATETGHVPPYLLHHHLHHHHHHHPTTATTTDDMPPETGTPENIETATDAFMTPSLLSETETGPL